MKYQHQEIAAAAESLHEQFESLSNKPDILQAAELKGLYGQLRLLPENERATFGREVNELRHELQLRVDNEAVSSEVRPSIDVTAPFDINIDVAHRPRLLPVQLGSIHPLMSELSLILDIFYAMGFTAVESPEIDDEYHMFSSLNFPEGHPARDDYDSFISEQTDPSGKPFVAPAHTSTMQHRILRESASALKNDQPIAAIIPGRVFRNEDVDARHSHTFHQFEGVYVNKGVNVGHLIATLKTFLQTYYGKTLKVKTQPFYFPFTEPSFEIALSCPFCDAAGCTVCSMSGWIELLGCGLIHPAVLREAGIDSSIYSGFAWGCGLERLVMMKYGIEDVRYFESGKLDFLRQFTCV